MILTDASGTTYRAHFRHEMSSRERARGMQAIYRHSSEPRWWVETTCTLHAGTCATNERPCGTASAKIGISRCSRSDNFDRRLGLKLSFERALWQMFPSNNGQPMRQQLWASFW